MGLQLVGAKYADALVLRAARAFEAACPQPMPEAPRAGPRFDFAPARMLGCGKSGRPSGGAGARSAWMGRHLHDIVRQGGRARGGVGAGARRRVEAKTLVFCSEGSPEGFNPQLFTAGTTFDASSSRVYNRLIEAERGTTNLPGLAESFTVSDDGLVYTFKLRPGVKWQTTEGFTPTRDFNADDVMFSIMRQLDPNHPFHKVSGGTYEYFAGSGLPRADQVRGEGRRPHGEVTLNEPNATFVPLMSQDFASILSAEYADQMMQAGTPEKVDLDPVGTGPFQLVGYQKDAVIRYKAHPDYWRARRRSTIWCSRSRRTPRSATRSSRPASAT